jgi:hypothetical protein
MFAGYGRIGNLLSIAEYLKLMSYLFTLPYFSQILQNEHVLNLPLNSEIQCLKLLVFTGI